jgi:hypothetical protein
MSDQHLDTLIRSLFLWGKNVKSIARYLRVERKRVDEALRGGL